MRGRAAAAELALAVGVAALIAGCAASQPGGGVPGRAGSSPSTAVSARSTAGSSGLAAAPVPAASLPVSLPSAASVSFADPTAVSQAAVITQWTMDTVTDASQYQAELRAAPFLTPAYVAQLRASPPIAAPGAQWEQWAAHRAYTTVSLIAEPDGNDAPADTPTVAYRQWGITVTPHGTGGWTGVPQTATVFVELSRVGPGQPWLVSTIYVDPS